MASETDRSGSGDEVGRRSDASVAPNASAGGAVAAAARAGLDSRDLPRAARAISELVDLGPTIDAGRLAGLDGATTAISHLYAGIDVSRFAGASEMARAASGVTELFKNIDTTRFTVTGAIDTSQFAAASQMARIASTLTGVLDTSQFTAGINTARLFADVTGAINTSHLTEAGEVTRIANALTGALDAVRFTQANIDFGGYDTFGAIGAAARIGSVLDGVKITAATAAAADMLRFISPATDVVSPVLDAARAAGRLHFGRLIHDLQLPDPTQLDPPNWPADLDIDIVTGILNEDGIPLVWVPRREIVTLLVQAPDRPSRIEILLGRVDELVEDCRRVLADIDHPTLVEQLPLATQALDAFAAGHRAPAHALATAVTDTLIKRAIQGSYKAVSKKVFFNPDTVPWHRLRLMAGLAPIGPFFTSWYPNSGTAAPEALSRHVTLHQAATSHYSPGNAVVAMLLATSILRCIQEMQGGTYTEAA